MNAVVKTETQTWKTETQVDRAVEAYSRKVIYGQVQEADQAEFERMLAWRRKNLVGLPPVKNLARLRRWIEKAG